MTEGRPVVALESTIITHGMAYPQNLRWWILAFLLQQSCKNDWWTDISILAQLKTLVRADGNVRLLGMQSMSSAVNKLYLEFQGEQNHMTRIYLSLYPTS